MFNYLDRNLMKLPGPLIGIRPSDNRLIALVILLQVVRNALVEVPSHRHLLSSSLSFLNFELPDNLCIRMQHLMKNVVPQLPEQKTLSKLSANRPSSY